MISSIKLSPHAPIYHKATLAIQNSQLIVLGPGDLYASLLPNALVEGFKESINKNSKPFVYIVNLMTHYSQTHNYTASDHVRAVTRYCGRQPDIVIVNSGKISPDILDKYATSQEYPVVDDLKPGQGYKIIRRDLVSQIKISQSDHDVVPRSLLRHDSAKLAKVLLSLI